MHLLYSYLAPKDGARERVQLPWLPRGYTCGYVPACLHGQLLTRVPVEGILQLPRVNHHTVVAFLNILLLRALLVANGIVILGPPVQIKLLCRVRIRLDGGGA